MILNMVLVIVSCSLVDCRSLLVCFSVVTHFRQHNHGLSHIMSLIIHTLWLSVVWTSIDLPQISDIFQRFHKSCQRGEIRAKIVHCELGNTAGQMRSSGGTVDLTCKLLVGSLIPWLRLHWWFLLHMPSLLFFCDSLLSVTLGSLELFAFNSFNGRRRCHHHFIRFICKKSSLNQASSALLCEEQIPRFRIYRFLFSL